MSHRMILVALMLVNAVVLLGQLWPAGAPPFARAVNIAFLAASFLYFLQAFVRQPARIESRNRSADA